MVKIAKSREKAKALYNTYKEKIWALIAKFIEEEIVNIAKWVGNISHFRQKIRKSIISYAVFISGIVLILIGFAEYLARVLEIKGYLSLIFVGFVAVVLSIIYHKS